MKHSHPSNHNGGPELTDDYIDVRHALMVAIRDCAEARGDPAFIGLVICTYMDRSGGIAHPSVRRIAEITGISVNRIASLAEQLQSYGLLIVHRSKGRGGIKYNARSIMSRPSPYIAAANVTPPRSPGRKSQCHR